MKNKEITRILLSSCGDDYNDVLKYLEKNKNSANKEILRIICSNLKSENSYIRERSANALVEIGDKSCVDPLIESLKDPNRFVRSSACEALGSIEDEKAIPHLKRMVDDKDYMVRTCALEALEFSPCSLSMEKIKERLHDKESLVRLYSTCLLDAKVVKNREIQEKAKNMLKERLKVERVGCVKSDILECLYIYEKDEKHFEGLVKLTKSKRRSARWRTYSSLGNVANDNNRKTILSLLKKALKEEQTKVMKDHIKSIIRDFS